MKNFNKILFLTLFATSSAFAQIPESFVKELVATKAKLDKKPVIVSKTEPTEDNFKEFGPLVDKAYTELESDKAEILKLKKGSATLKERVSVWVKVAALSTALDPSNSSVELSAEIEKKFPLEFNESIEGLEKNLKARFLDALKVFKRVRKEGNAG